MTRYLNALGLALTSMLAAGTLTAVTAHAEDEGHFIGADVQANHISTFVTGEETEGELEFTFDENSVSCGPNLFYAEIPGGTSKTLTIQPTFLGSGTGAEDSPCFAAGWPLKVDENGCHLHFSTAETISPPTTHAWEVTTGITCPEGVQGIQWTMTSGSINFCTFTLVPQVGLSGVTLHSDTSGDHDDLTATFDLSIEATPQPPCVFPGVVTIHGDVTMQGVDPNGESVDLYVAHTKG